MPRSPNRRALPLVLCAFALLGLPAAARADRTFEVDATLGAGGRSGGFLVAPPEQVRAPAGAYANDQFGALYWCDPYPGTHIKSATIHAYRFHTVESTARIEVGPSMDGSLGHSVPERQLVPGFSGRQFALGPMNAQCVGARARQTGAQTLAEGRIWSFFLDGKVTLVDDQGPSVDEPSLSPPQGGGRWYTGPLTATWTQTDNAWLRGSTGIEIGGTQIDLGDRPDGQVSATLDPGPDGPQTVRVYRSADSWERASWAAAIVVDRTPPSPPTLVSTPSGTALPVAVLAGGSLDAVSELDHYEYSFDGGATISTGPPLLALPGVYGVIARAVDKAGNTGAWAGPLIVSVLPSTPAALAPPPPLAPGAAPGAPPPAGAGGAQALPDLTGARIGLGFSDVLRPGGLALVDYDVPATIGGRLTGAQGSGLAAVGVVLRDGRGRDLARTTTDGEGGFALAFRGQRNGRLVIAALGQPELSAAVALRVRPLLEVRPARVDRTQGIRVVVPVSGRTIVLRGTVRPRALARGKRVQLQFVDGQGKWQPGPAEARVDRHGRFALRYRFGQPGRAIEGLARVTVPADTGWPLAAAEGVPLRVSVPAE